MTPVDRPVRPEGDDTPPVFTAGQLVEWWDDFEQVWVPASIARLSTELPQTMYLLRLQPSGARWAHASELRAASAAPETSPDPTDLPGYEHLIFLHDRFTDVIGEQHGATPGDIAWALLPAVHAEIVRLLADKEAREAIAARSATPTETTEH